MISVLIPNYNFNCLQLVRDLHSQLTESGVPFEIVVVEDGSTEFLENNGKMSSLAGVRHIVRKENVGRFKMRALLPELAKYPYLLCIDSDAGVIRPDFISKYVDLARKGETAVFCGGIDAPQPVFSKESSLRCTYERTRGNNGRRKSGFTSFNYMIPERVLRRMELDDGWNFSYGHEDTIFGIKLKRMGVPVVFINNPLSHFGEENARFLQKSVEAGNTLLQLHNSGKYPELPGESRLLSCYLRVNHLRMAPLLRFAFRLSEKAVLRNLNGLHPSMVLFDFYRLGKMLSLNR